jgi:hypothetical protein
MFLTGSIDYAHRSSRCQQETNTVAPQKATTRGNVNKPVSTVTESYITNCGVPQNVTVHYALIVLSDPNQLSLEDELILHGLGVTWKADKTQARLCRSQINDLSTNLALRLELDRREVSPCSNFLFQGICQKCDPAREKEKRLYLRRELVLGFRRGLPCRLFELGIGL